jgi:hypothetical protein
MEGEPEEQEDEDPIHNIIQNILMWCKENDALFGDSAFPANDSSLFSDPTNPPLYAVENDIIMDWRRPEEICTDQDPVMIKDNASPGDIKQG